MKKLSLIFVLIACTGSLSSCSTEAPELKSPCVGLEGSPCDKRSPDNQYLV